MDFCLSVERDGERRGLVAAVKGDDGPPPKQNRGFQEMREAVFRGPENKGWRLLIDDVPLTMDEARPGVWIWEPGFYAGEVEATLQDAAGSCQGSWHLDVSPDANKLGRDAFIGMLREIYEFDPALALGKEPAPAGRQFGALGEHQDPVIEFLRLRSRATDIEQSLRVLLQEPNRSLRTRRRLSPPHMVRRADRHTAVSALRQPALLAAIGIIQTDAIPSFTRQPLANVPTVSYHYDNATNRCLLHALRALIRRCKSLHARLGTEANQGDSAIAQRWPEWKKFLDVFHRNLKTAERRLPFPEVTRAEVSAAGLNAVAAHPLCARFWHVSWEALPPRGHRAGTSRLAAPQSYMEAL